MQPNKPQNALRQHNNVDGAVVKTWTMPYPGCNSSWLRPKQFRVVRLEDGNLAFCKTDTAPEYIAHEAEILSALSELECVPSLICQTPTAIYTTYINGRLLPDAIESLGITACVRAGWQILVIVASVHRKGVVHGDVRPWNFIYGDNARLYLIDFEYAYSHNQLDSDAVSLLEVHHGLHLKTPFSEWIDAQWCVANVWRASTHRTVRSVLVYVPLGIHWGMRKILRLKVSVTRLINALRRDGAGGAFKKGMKKIFKGKLQKP